MNFHDQADTWLNFQQLVLGMAAAHDPGEAYASLS